MATPIFLIPFDGTLDGQDRDGPMSATASGDVTYVDGAAPGSQAVRPDGDVRITLPATYINPAKGSFALRYRRHTNPDGNDRYLFSLGAIGTNSFFCSVRFNETSMWLRNSDGTPFHTTSTPAVDTWQTLYVEWNDDAWGINYGGGLLTTPRSGGFSAASSGIALGAYLSLDGFHALCDIDDAMLTDITLSPSQQERLFSASAWSWSMFPDLAPVPLITPGSNPITMLSPH